jgi:ribonuclease HI/IMP dehydrogenase/GMP reductase
LGKQIRKLIAHIDGASLGNPGRAGAGVTFEDDAGTEIEAFGLPIGEATNNVAEYRALILALEKARRLGARQLTVFSDSELLVKQLNGQYRVKTPHLRSYFDRAQRLRSDFENFQVAHVPREQNRRADALARQAARRQSSDQSAQQSASEHSPGSPPPAPQPMKRKPIQEALALNEVALLPGWSEVPPDEVDTQITLADDIRLGIPLLASLTCSQKTVSLAAITALRGAMALLRPGPSQQELVGIVRKIKTYQPADEEVEEEDSAAACLDGHGRPRVGVVIHPDDDLVGHVGSLQQVGVDLLVLEASLGHGAGLVAGITRLKDSYPELPLLAGDVTDAQGAEKILEAGAEGIKVGAPYILGLKVPLFSAIQECTQVVGERGNFLLADVGTTELMVASSRVVRVLGAGADAAIATLDPSGEEWQPHILAEGLDNLADDIRMIMSCCGAGTIEEFHRTARFVRV